MNTQTHTHVHMGERVWLGSVLEVQAQDLADTLLWTLLLLDNSNRGIGRVKVGLSLSPVSKGTSLGPLFHRHLPGDWHFISSLFALGPAASQMDEIDPWWPWGMNKKQALMAVYSQGHRPTETGPRWRVRSAPNLWDTDFEAKRATMRKPSLDITKILMASRQLWERLRTHRCRAGFALPAAFGKVLQKRQRGPEKKWTYGMTDKQLLL